MLTITSKSSYEQNIQEKRQQYFFVFQYSQNYDFQGRNISFTLFCLLHAVVFVGAELRSSNDSTRCFPIINKKNFKENKIIVKPFCKQ